MKSSRAILNAVILSGPASRRCPCNGSMTWTGRTLPATNVITYVPSQPGNYLVRWTNQRHGVEYRYFAAIDQSYVVYRPAVWCWPTPFPATGGAEIHNGGLPLDWCLDATTVDASYHARLRDEQQRYGGGLVYGVDIACQNAASAEAVSASAEARC